MFRGIKCDRACEKRVDGFGNMRNGKMKRWERVSLCQLIAIEVYGNEDNT